MKKFFRLILHRVVIVGALIAIQAAILVAMIIGFQDYFVYFYGFCILLSILSFLLLIGNKSNPAYKIAWLIPILLFPIFGGLFYLLFGVNQMSQREKKKMHGIIDNFSGVDFRLCPMLDKLSAEDPSAANQARYIQNTAACPPYQGTSVEYLPLGEVKFQRMLEELKKARHYIFLEYFIIEEGKMWDPILEVLVQKVQEGLDVRVMYDDLGSIMTLPANYKQKLEALGIQCHVFNPFVPVLSTRLNNRDHRKICVIDGYVGFNGGINLADEYINAFPKHGHWKDTALLLKGEAVWSLTMMFLSVWDYSKQIHENYEQFLPCVYQPMPIEDDGYVQPYSDNPLDDDPVGETVYLNLINKAEREVYITTPYLIISNEMLTALCTAAKSGIDVRIITPYVADKWFVHAVTRAYYESLVEAGVKIYEYTPGFIHAKSFVVDGNYAVVGTINLDYRSLYLHFECATWLYRSRCIADIREDFLQTQAVSQQITLEYCRNVSGAKKLLRGILRVFAPLM